MDKILSCFKIKGKNSTQQSVIQKLLPLYDKALGIQCNKQKRFIFTARAFLPINNYFQTNNNNNFFINPDKNFPLIWKNNHNIFDKDYIFSTFTQKEKKVIKECIQKIKKINEWSEVFQAAIKIEHEEIKTASTPRLFGLIIIGNSFFKMEERMQIEYLVHELGHQEVFLLNLIDNLTTQETKNQLKYSSFPKKHRPPLARFHAYYSVYKTVEYNYNFSLEFNEENIKHLDQTAQSLTQDELTPLAQDLLSLWQENLKYMKIRRINHGQFSRNS